MVKVQQNLQSTDIIFASDIQKCLNAYPGDGKQLHASTGCGNEKTPLQKMQYL